MKILGIGNAIVDVICKVDEDFISKNGLTKSTMKLIFDESEFQSSLKISFIVPFVKLFTLIKSSSTLQITSTIALPIPKISILYSCPLIERRQSHF